MDLLCYSTLKEKVCLRFYPCKDVRDGKNWWDDWHKHEPLTVYISDYEKLMLVEYFNKVYPIIDDGEEETAFDVCTWNWIAAEYWQKIIVFIKNDIKTVSNEQEKQFYFSFVDWIENQLEWADTIVVDGNQ